MGKVDYLRLSVTDLCNLNCIYCTPLKKRQFLTHDEVLRYEEMARLIQLSVKAGIRKVRLTGGEPLIKKNIITLIRLLREINGLEEISMTSNGVLLFQLAPALKEAGLDRINVSLDTLKKERFRRITGMDCFDQVWQGIQKSLQINLKPLKLNIIPMRGINDDEIVDFARLTLEQGFIVRFIEFFHTNQRSKKLISSLIPSRETKNIIKSKLGELKPAEMPKGNGPAVYYQLKDAKGAIGFISGTTGNFCYSCNRIRLDCAGRISPCLFSGCLYDARPLIRGTQDDYRLLEDIKGILNIKPRHVKLNIKEPQIEMSSLGG